MIGLGVGIDYALFIVTRYRQGLAEGRDPRRGGRQLARHLGPGRPLRRLHRDHLAARAVHPEPPVHARHGRSGPSPPSSSSWPPPSPCCPPCSASPAGRSTSSTCPGCCSPGRQPGRSGFWYRWSRTVQRHPWATGLTALLVLLVLAIPLFSMRLAFTDAGNDPTSLTTRQAFDLLAEGFGPGFNGPARHRRRAPARVGEAGRRPPRARPVGPRRASPRWRRPSSTPPATPAVIVAYPTTAPQAAETEAAGPPPAQTRSSPRPPPAPACTALVGGETAASVDAAAYLQSRLLLGDRGGDPARLPAAHGRVPLGRHPAQGGGHEPAVGRRRLRGHRRRLPVGLGRLDHRHRIAPAPSTRGSRS